MFVLRSPILALSRSKAVRDLTTTLPLTRAVVQRFVAGERTEDGVAAVRRLRADGLQVTLDHLGEDIADAAGADSAVAAYLDLIDALSAAGLTAGAELSVKLSAVGSALTGTTGVNGGNSADRTDGIHSTAGIDGAAYALAGARKIADAAYGAGARLTLDMEDHRTVDSTLDTLRLLREDHPDVGVALQAMLLRTPDDLAGLLGAGSRVRLVKGAYDEPEEVAFTDPPEIDRAYVRCLKMLMAGSGYPMVGSHDPRLIRIAGALAADNGRGPETYEHQLLYGIRPDEQRRLVATGKTVRVYLPYGSDWYGYFTRRLAERPANLVFFLRAMASRS